MATHNSISRTVPAPPSEFARRRVRRVVERGREPATVTDVDETTTFRAQHQPETYRTTAAASSSRKRSTANCLAWAHAYLAANDPQAALVCFFEVMGNASVVSDPSFDRTGALQFAERVANVFLNQGQVDNAADLLRFMAMWEQEIFVPQAAMTSERTVVARNPLLAEERTVSTAPAREDLTGMLTIARSFDEQRTIVRPMPGEETTVFRGKANDQTAVRLVSSQPAHSVQTTGRARTSARRLVAVPTRA
ncbi:MAG: hypothetical protein AAGF11_32370 [Myxococcota bacterium]